MNDDPYIAQGYHGNYVPRAVCVDLEPGVVNNIKVDPYMQKTCDVAEKAIWPKKIAEKVCKSGPNVNCDNSA